MSLEQTIDNLQIRNANMVTFVGTSNTMVDTTTGRIQTKGIQHNSNVITDVSGPHGRGVATLKKYPEIDFDASKLDRNDSTNTYVQAGYTVSASSVHSEPYQPWKAFDDNISNNTGWLPNFTITDHNYSGSEFSYSPTGTSSLTTNTSDVINGEWLQIKLPSKIQLSSIVLHARSGNSTQIPEDFKVLGSNTGIDGSWVVLATFLDESGAVNSGTEYDINALSYYNYYALITTQVVGDGGTNYGLSIAEWKLYGYEEDPPAGDHSVDTTFKSRFNNPQTTGVQVLVDGATGVGTNQISGGPDPSGNQSTYVTDGKYWTLNGTLTSNLSVEANTFLEGDQPHAVSVWFNSSNLEANVSNTCVFSIASEEKLDSVNLDLQSNTWHNLTYAYQGEGGSRVTYLDGRKVSEDQAEDTFGEYPPFEIGTYSLGGYTVDASYWNEGASGTRLAYNMFQAANGGRVTGFTSDGSSGAILNTADANYDATLMTLTDTSGTAHLGHWVSLELPYKLSPSYCEFEHYGTSYRLKDFVILGSNHNPRDVKTGFTLLFSGQAHVDNNGTNKTIHTFTGSGKFNYLILLTKTLNNNNSTWIINRLQYYGHRENDLVRLPDPTNVLKYPHITMTGPAQRGYVVTASTEYGGSGSDYQAWNAFDGLTGTLDYWSGGGGAAFTTGLYNSSDPFNFTGSGAPYATSVSGTTYTGDWIQLEMPHKLVLNKASVKTGGTATNRFPRQGVFAGSNDGVNWYAIHIFSGLNGGTAETSIVTNSENNTEGYKYIRLIITHLNGNGYVGLATLNFYGTGVDSIPIQIGGGNIDKLANFRVYDKFIDENQALEIWDAQKEEFGRAKPQMVLQQGKLGIGTDAPQGSLSVADEPHNVEEFPPRALSDDKTYIEGHGEFCTNASNTYQTGDYESYKAFNKNSTGGTYTWWSQSDIASVPTYSTSTGEFSSTDSSYSTNVEGGTKYGHWLQIEFPYKINYRYSDIQGAHHSIGRQPRAGYILGSNDLMGMWTSLHKFTNVTRTHKYESVRYTPPTVSTQTFKYFRLVIEEQGNYQYTGIARWDIFGTREQGQSVLHDGQLTLTKNLNVPRIGPPLDADDTPRRDRLVVEYNTSTNPTFEGAVRDTSGRGFDGMFYGNATYDAVEKALVFDGNGDYVVSGDLGIPSGAFVHSVSLWCKRDSQGSNMYLSSIGGENETLTSRFSMMLLANAGTIHLSISGSNSTFTGDITTGSWFHIVYTYNGGAQGSSSTAHTVYVNGIEKPINGGTNAMTLNLPENSRVALGSQPWGGSNYFDGSISNFKLYDKILTAEEVKTLYDMGRMGGKANPQPLHISGPVNVMGDIRYITNIRPLALPTMWDHEANGHFTRGIYPITGTQGGSKVYNMLCEPDWCGGGWMCAAQLPKGKDVVTTPVNLFTADYGDPSNLTWSNDFAVPMNIFSNDSGYDLDVMLVLLGGTRAGRAGAGGARNGGIYRGVNLTQALNTGWPTNGAYPAYISTSGLASSADGYTFVSRTISGNNFRPYKANTGWRLSFSSLNGNDMAYNDSDINTMGWLVHTNGNNLHYTYSSVHGGGGSQAQNGDTSWSAIRFFVRPKRY